MSEANIQHFNGSEEALIRQDIVRSYDHESGFEAAWERAMNISDTHERRKRLAVLRDLQGDLLDGYCFEETEPLVSSRAHAVKELAVSAMAATTLFVTNCSNAIQRISIEKS